MRIIAASVYFLCTCAVAADSLSDIQAEANLLSGLQFRAKKVIELSEEVDMWRKIVADRNGYMADLLNKLAAHRKKLLSKPTLLGEDEGTRTLSDRARQIIAGAGREEDRLRAIRHEYETELALMRSTLRQVSKIPTDLQSLLERAEATSQPRDIPAKLAAQPANPPAPKITLYKLKSGVTIRSVKTQDFGDSYVLKDETGKLNTVAKGDVESVTDVP
jgi:hypothetical protein